MPKRAVIDGSMLLDIQDGDRAASDLFELLRQNHYQISLTPTGVHELIDVAMHSGERLEAVGSLAAGIKAWQKLGLTCHDLDALEHGLCLEAANALIKGGAFSDLDINLALIVAEAATLEANYLILDDDVVAAMNLDLIHQILSTRHLTPPKILGRLHSLRILSQRQ